MRNVVTVAIFSIMIRIESPPPAGSVPARSAGESDRVQGANVVTVEPGAPGGSAGRHHRSFGKKEF